MKLRRESLVQVIICLTEIKGEIFYVLFAVYFLAKVGLYYARDPLIILSSFFFFAQHLVNVFEIFSIIAPRRKHVILLYVEGWIAKQLVK
jgi:hypothetical protein